MNTYNKYRYRRQYIIGQDIRTLDEFNQWQSYKINKNLYITSHPDLLTTYIRKGDRQLILMGFIIDPFNPELSNDDILKVIISNSDSFKDILHNTYSYGGRWALIYKSEIEFKMFHDLCGLRQIFYTEHGNRIWCASQPNTLAKLLKIKKDNDESLLKFVNSKEYKSKEGFWVGDKTIYKGIYHLLPNHYLDLLKGTPIRYFIDNEDVNIEKNEAINVLSKGFKGSILAINNRYKTLQAVSAGIDSRILLAASKESSDDIHYYVSTMNILKPTHMDIKTPKSLMERLVLDFDVFDNLSPLREEFQSTLKNNVSMSRILPKTLTIQHELDNYDSYINVNGNGSEIARMYYGDIGSDKIDALYLADVLGYKSYDYVINELNDWLRSIDKSINIKILDLLYWEQRMGNWGAMFPAEQDIAIEEFCPYNNRQLIMTLLRVDKKYRSGPDYILNKELTKELWPETLLEPINPISIGNRFKMVVSKALPKSIKRLIKLQIENKKL